MRARSCLCAYCLARCAKGRAGLFGDEEARARLEGMGGLHALGRIGEVEEVAEAITYLLRARSTTGAIVDGGSGLGLTQGWVVLPLPP